MEEQNKNTTLCPYCGYDVGGESYCVACGKELEEIIAKPFSLRKEFQGLCSWLKEKGFDGGELEERAIDPPSPEGIDNLSETIDRFP